MTELSKRLKYAMDVRNVKQVELVEKTGINKGALSSYLSGRYSPKQNNIYKLAIALNVNEAWLMGVDTTMERQSNSSFNNLDEKSSPMPPHKDLLPIGKKRLPLFDGIACGEPRLIPDAVEVYVDATTELKADYVLKAHGDSMSGARIHDGDLVFIRQQPSVETGEIAAVLIDDSATLKRVYWYAQNTLLVLRAENPEYEDMEFSGKELENIRILGKAVAFQSDVR